MMPIMKDFTRQAKVVQFKIDDDLFRGKPHLPAQTMIDFTISVESIDEKSATPKQGFTTMMDSLQMVLMPESYDRFKARMQPPGEGESYVPIELEQLPDILDWIMGQYGMRPTQSSGDSSNGQSSLASGTNSTESTSDVELISANSPSTDS